MSRARPGTGVAGTPGTPIRDTGTTNVTACRNAPAATGSSSATGSRSRRTSGSSPIPSRPRRQLLANDFEMGRRNPEAVLEANWVRGKFKRANASAFLQRELARDLNLELGFNRQTSRGDTRNLATWNHYGIAADTNRYLPTGQLKPADQLYYFDVSPDHRPSVRRSIRAPHALLRARIPRPRDAPPRRPRRDGEHEIAQRNSPAILAEGPGAHERRRVQRAPENGANQASTATTFPASNRIDDPNFRIPAPYDLSGPTRYQDPRTGAVSNIYMREFNRSQGNIGYADRDTGAYMGVAQAFLLKNRLVGTFGYRKDRLKNWVGVAFRDPAGEAIAPTPACGRRPIRAPSIANVFSGRPARSAASLHVTSWLSVFFNTSNSVSTPGTNYITPSDPRQTTLADLVPSPSGKTTDYGIKLSLLKNRSSSPPRSSTPSRKSEFGFSGFNKGNVVNIWNALANSGGLNAEETTFARRQAEVMNMVQGYTQDSESRGLELEVVGQILPGWSISVNYSKNETTRTNIASEYRAYLDTHKAYWKRFATTRSRRTPTPPASNSRPAPRTGAPRRDRATGDFTVNTDSINEAIADAEQLFFDNPHVFEGRRFVGDPLHNINLRTRYDFRGGCSRASPSAPARASAGRVAGARTDYTIAAGLGLHRHVERPHHRPVTTVNAKDQNVYDLQLSYTLPAAEGALQRKLVRWSVQLNVNNVLDQRRDSS
jgi:hypothetical protein